MFTFTTYNKEVHHLLIYEKEKKSIPPQFLTGIEKLEITSG